MSPEFPADRMNPLGIAQQSFPAAQFHFLRIRIPLYRIDSWDHQIYLPIYLPVFLLYLNSAKVQGLRDMLLTLVLLQVRILCQYLKFRTFDRRVL